MPTSKQLIRLASASATLAISLGLSPARATQLVLLDFETFTDPGEFVYSSADQHSILSNIAADYALFDFEFTLTQPTTGDFSTLFFNAGPVGGVAEIIDFRNLDKNDIATININGLLDAPGVTPLGLSSFIGAHELGHLQGLRHGDSFGPIGSGLPTTGIPTDPDYLPPYPGPAHADETTGHIIATPAIGQSITEANENGFFSERSAVKLSFNERGSVVSESAASKHSFATAQALTFDSLDVPNTLLSGDNAGKKFWVDALTVTGSLATESEADFFSFEGKAGDLFNFEVISDAIAFSVDPFEFSFTPRDNFDPIDSQISIFNSGGDLIPYFNGLAFNDNEFEGVDSILLDLTLPEDDTYFIKINASTAEDVGNYELFGYRFAAVPEPSMILALGLAAISLLTTAQSRKQRQVAKQT